MIISASRRTDLPRFYWDWFLQELERGETRIANPFNANQIRTISLLPEAVDGFVFWTRDPSHIAESAELLINRSYLFYVMVSITGYPEVLEPHAPDLESVVGAVQRLSGRIGKDHVFWRYDPVLLSSLTTKLDHLKGFSNLAEQLRNLVGRCIISLYDYYGKSERRLQALEASANLRRFPLYTENRGLSQEAEELVAEIAGLSHQYEIPLYSCAEPTLLERFGILPNSCVDGELFGKKHEKDPNQRPNCHCDRSVDIGFYRSCPAHCVYCYAW